ncbi:TetR/AcrR family transcriptional regulator [Actinokineospora sp. NBRC 105648]|uniref:TetR/AcrR family transcriptional regulator n=1 Tax=Actinokineospora sp. NBRC 105648 TaxID=3032206 RepID=UPI0024A41E02|nr:TetR/AcrR family transcriptional regulator [Actinokineospora sp. NBRC 105648]GLZ41017.1 TetR family transcriptional regulator [Actinokineospora sp. NBRC 105648]
MSEPAAPTPSPQPSGPQPQAPHPAAQLPAAQLPAATQPAAPRRRTQRERREATVGKLVEATIEAISEVGYARASVQEICRRAGVSHGGLFRHFETRLDLVVRVSAEVGRRQLADFLARTAPFFAGGDDFLDVLRAIREASRSPLNIVWFELLLAARTDAELRARLAPTIESYSKDIYLTALRIPAIAAQPDETRQAAVFAGLHMFDVETLVNAVYPRPDLDEGRLRLVAHFYETSVQVEGLEG